MRFSLSAPVHFEEATPRGPLTFDFPAGEIEPADDSDERYVIEHKLVPSGHAVRVMADAAPPAPAPAPDAPAPDAPAPEHEGETFTPSPETPKE